MPPLLALARGDTRKLPKEFKLTTPFWYNDSFSPLSLSSMWAIHVKDALPGASQLGLRARRGEKNLITLQKGERTCLYNSTAKSDRVLPFQCAAPPCYFQTERRGKTQCLTVKLVEAVSPLFVFAMWRALMQGFYLTYSCFFSPSREAHFLFRAQSPRCVSGLAPLGLDTG